VTSGRPTLVSVPGGALDGVAIAPFRLARTQTTNAEYDAFLTAAGRAEPPFRRASGFEDREQPVVAVSWFDAVAYCEWLSAALGDAVRLPTEAEWEWAARGGREAAAYPWGGEAPELRYPDYAALWRLGPAPVGRHLSNEYGLYEMCENVHEWCANWHDEKKARRASRGGSWRHQRKVSLCAGRSSIPPHFQYADYGFRVAGDAER